MYKGSTGTTNHKNNNTPEHHFQFKPLAMQIALVIGTSMLLPSVSVADCGLVGTNPDEIACLGFDPDGYEHSGSNDIDVVVIGSPAPPPGSTTTVEDGIKVTTTGAGKTVTFATESGDVVDR